jgi:hypothetical protein
MKRKLLIPLLSLLFPMMSFGRATVPKAEVAFGYSFINVHPEYPQISSFNLNGGGAAFVYNVTPLIGIKAEYMDYTGDGGAQLRKLGYTGNL